LRPLTDPNFIGFRVSADGQKVAREVEIRAELPDGHDVADGRAKRMIILVFILVSLMTLGNFVDFLLGSGGQRGIKDRLVDFYVSIDEGDWTTIIRKPAAWFTLYFDFIFGPRYISIRVLFVMVLYSMTVSSFAIIISALF
jgi:hypothetical protein